MIIMFEPSQDVLRQIGVLKDQKENHISDEVQALRRIGGKVHDSPPRHPYYDSEKFKRDQAYFDSALNSEHFTFKDFWFWFSHAYHDPALPPPSFGYLVGAFGWVVMIVWGIHWLCS